jgi:4-diphosphocytidyl-2-C-methyl-D-erythritol kinase
VEGDTVSLWSWGSAWPAPAKLNLFLHVVGRRPDGYHLLQTVYRFIDRADTLHFAPRDDGDVVLATPTPGVEAANDLTVRAARLLREATGCHRGATLHLSKNLPLGGGLGGGSSDAATVLLALNHLWQAGLSRAELEQLGLQLGADVPVFVHGRNTFAEGVGEAFSDVELPPATYLVLHPAVNVATGFIFGAPDLRRDTPPITAAAWLPGDGSNDLEPVACALYPEVARHLEFLRRFGDARMSGSGSCCFVALPDRAAADAALAACPAEFQGFVARGLDRHPLAIG